MNQENRYQPPTAEVADVAGSEVEELASRWARLGGALLDGLLVSIFVFPFMYFTGIWQAIMSGGGKMPSGTQLEFGLLALVLYLLLHGYFLHKYGQTIGKRLVGTRIVSVDDNRILPLWKVFVLRFLPITLAGQIPVVGQFAAFIDPLLVFRGDKRCIHDLIAGTKVINASAPWKGLADADNTD